MSLNIVQLFVVNLVLENGVNRFVKEKHSSGSCPVGSNQFCHAKDVTMKRLEMLH